MEHAYAEQPTHAAAAAEHAFAPDETMPPGDVPGDAGFALDADALLAPPTEAELRALRGHPLARFARPLLGALAASLIGGVLIALAASGPDAASVEAPPEPARTTATSAGTPTDAAPPLADYAASARSEKGDAAPVLFAPAGGFIAVSRAPAADATPKRPEDPTLRDARSDGSRSATSFPDPREDPIPAEPTMARSEGRDGASPRRSLPAAPSPMTTPDR